MTLQQQLNDLKQKQNNPTIIHPSDSTGSSDMNVTNESVIHSPPHIPNFNKYGGRGSSGRISGRIPWYGGGGRNRFGSMKLDCRTTNTRTTNETKDRNEIKNLIQELEQK